MDEGSLTSSTSNPPSVPPEAAPENPVPATPEWKDEITSRVHAHRARSPRTPENQPVLPGMEDALSSSSIAARVAERYARLPSYRETLAAQAAAAKPAVDSFETAASATPATQQPQPAQPHIEIEPPIAELAPEACQPDLLRYSVSTDSLPAPRSTPPEAHIDVPPPSAYPADLVPGLADPLEATLVEPAQPLPTRLLMSPRELVAPRKARPRLAEGPLRDDPFAPDSAADPDPQPQSVAEEPQPVANSPAEAAEYRIPEPKTESASPAPNPSAPPEWRSIQLDTEVPIPKPQHSSATVDERPLHVASIEDRAMAALIDAALTLSAFLLFYLVFILCTTSLPNGRIALIGACVTLFAMWLLYQLLFFTLTDATPGMRYAKIALCTFNDDNPSRSMLRGRIAAMLLSALPLGLGFLWAVFDEDSLGWHDRITQTYQRSYRDQ
jgi:uncharacterized RDD family membrane protein YckC